MNIPAIPPVIPPSSTVRHARVIDFTGVRLDGAYRQPRRPPPRVKFPRTAR